MQNYANTRAICSEMAENVLISRQEFSACIDSLLPLFKIRSLTKNQFEALYWFTNGKEVYVSLPTGSGKSVIFHLVPLVHSWMFERNQKFTHWIKEPVIVIICPLLALMKDQVKILTACGLKASYIGGEQDEKTLDAITNGLFTYVFLSPESALSNERWRNMLSSDIYKAKLVGIIVDEVHCITEWGFSRSNDKRDIFRRWYSRINEARSFTNVPFMALTATATKMTKNNIFEQLEFESPVEITESPNKNNISYCVQALDKKLSLADNFRCLIEEIRKKGKDSMRTIIYCQTVKQCSILYKIFETELQESFYLDHEKHPPNRLVEMLHSGTPDKVKEHVMMQFSNSSFHLRVLIATIAYGMGVNCKGVRRVIHFGPSNSVQAYIQESGRCGRAGERSTAVLLYNRLTLKVADSAMKEYVKTDSCRRKVLLGYFDSKLPSVLPTGHSCCDNCSLSCKCQGSHCDVDLNLPSDQELFSVNEEQYRNVSHDQVSNLTSKLRLLQKKLMMKSLIGNESNMSIYVGYPNMLLEFGKEQIDKIIKSAATIFTIRDIMEKVDIWKKDNAYAVLQIFAEVFCDVEVPLTISSDEESDDECLEQEWELRDDPSFMELINQSDWDLESSLFDEQDSVIE